MKKFLMILIVTTLVFSLMGCTNKGGSQSGSRIEKVSNGNSSTVEKEKSDSSNVENDGGVQDDANKILIAYFSYSGNTQKIANMIAENTGGDLVRIETTNPYPKDYNTVLDVAQKEQKENARPELSTEIENIHDYDIIFLGYPNWWGTMPMAILSFLEKYDLSGKTIVPFCTHGGSAFGTSEKDITSIYSDATLLKGIAVRDSDVDSAKSDVKKWIDGLDIVE